VTETLLSRFLRYVQIDTRSDADNLAVPSTAGQWDLLKLLAGELQAMGAQEVRLTEHGYVMATLPATTRRPDLPVVAFMAHVDTAYEFSGQGVKPLVHRKWNGRPLRLPDDATQVLDPAVHPRFVVGAQQGFAAGRHQVFANGRQQVGGGHRDDPGRPPAGAPRDQAWQAAGLF